MSFTFSWKLNLKLSVIAVLFWNSLAYGQSQSGQRNKTRQAANQTKDVSPSPKVVVPDSMSLSKVYPFKPQNLYFVSGGLTTPLRTHSATNGIAASAGLRRGLLEFYVTLLRENRVWRQLEQRPSADVYNSYKGEFTADEPDKVKVRSHLLKFQWSASDLFSLWAFDGGFGLRYPAPFLSDDFSLHSSTFISFGGLSESNVTASTYSTRGAGLKMMLFWNVPALRSMNVMTGFRYSVLEASGNGFSDAADQLSVQTFGLLNGVEWFL